ncbi:MAG: regulatory protein RecX [Clostridia bacterium]|nr:regulatory protein RecX [Clostridia bacterium]
MIVKARNYGAYCLGKKFLTEEELYKKLCDKGYSEVAPEVLAEFTKAGIIDDKNYAYMYISDGINIKCKGLFRLRDELIKKGVDKGIIDAVSAEFEEDCYNSLVSFMKAHYGDEKISDRKTLDKIKAQLLRRGYSYGEIRRCFDEFDWSDF